MKKFIVSTLILGLTFSLSSVCFAFRVSPAKLELAVKRNKNATVVLHLRGSTFNEKIKLYSTNFLIGRRGNLSFEKLENWKYSALPWIKLDEKTLTLAKGRTKDFEFKIKVPYRAKPGEYYGAIMIEPTEFTPIERKIGGVKVVLNLKSRIAVPIILTIPGRVPKRGGKVHLVRVEAGKEEIKILSTFNNTGNVLEEVRGRVTVRDAVKRRIFDVVRLKALNGGHPDGSGKVFPETLRDFAGEVQRPLPPGEYVAEAAFDYGYKYRLAKARTTFTVTPQIAQKQRELLTLAVEPELLELKIPAGGFRTLGIKVSNLDYQPIHVKMHFNPVANPSWIRLSESEFDLPPGRSKTLRVILSIPRGEKPERSIKIELKADRGKKVVADVVVLNPRIEKEKIAKKDNGNL